MYIYIYIRSILNIQCKSIQIHIQYAFNKSHPHPLAAPPAAAVAAAVDPLAAAAVAVYLGFVDIHGFISYCLHSL